MNGENSRNGLYERSGTETDDGKEEKRGLFSLFSGGGEGTGMKKIPLLLLLCGALGLFLILAGGDLPFFKKDDSPSSFSGANGKDEATLKAEPYRTARGRGGGGKNRNLPDGGGGRSATGHRRTLRGGRGADCTEAGHRSFVRRCTGSARTGSSWAVLTAAPQSPIPGRRETEGQPLPA